MVIEYLDDRHWSNFRCYAGLSVKVEDTIGVEQAKVDAPLPSKPSLLTAWESKRPWDLVAICAVTILEILTTSNLPIRRAVVRSSSGRTSVFETCGVYQ